MKTFMIQYVLSISQYMEDRSKKENRTILVQADSEEKAKETLDAYYEKRSDSFSTYYTVTNYEVIPSIKQVDFLK